MKTLHVFAAVAMLSMASSAMAADEAKDDEPKKEEKVCRSEKVTGSLTRVTRVCMTQAEWDKLRERTNTELGRLDKNNNSRAIRTPTGGMGPGGPN